MLTHHDLLFGLVLPALVGGALFLLARYAAGKQLPPEAIGRTSVSGIGRDASPFALVLGYLATETALLGRPAIPPTQAAQWISFALLALGILSAVYEVCAGSVWRYYLPVAIGGVLLPAICLLVRPLAEHHWSRTETTVWIAGLTAVALFETIALDRLFSHRPGPIAATCLVLVLAIAGVVLLLSGTKTYAQLAAAGAAALGPGALLATFGRGRPFSQNIVPAFVLLLGGLLLAGHQYASLTAFNALLLLFAPLGLWLGRLPTAARWQPWQRGLLQLTAVALPAIVATGLAAKSFLEQAATGY